MKEATPHSRRWPVFVLCASLGALWIVTALSKAQYLLSGSGLPDSQPSWSDGFSVPLQFAVVGTEVLIGVWLLFGNRVRGLVTAVVLLGVFSIALLITPPASGQSCGCGVVAEVLPFDPIARNALLAGLHVVVLALVAQPRPRKAETLAPHAG